MLLDFQSLGSAGMSIYSLNLSREKVFIFICILDRRNVLIINS